MPAEYLNENGQLCQGYCCATCGKGSGMYGHKDCEPNPDLVQKIGRINRAGSIEQYLINVLKGEYEEPKSEWEV